MTKLIDQCERCKYWHALIALEVEGMYCPIAERGFEPDSEEGACGLFEQA